MDNNYNQIFAKRLKDLSVDLINQLSELAYSEKVSVIRKQVFRSSSSSAANYRAMCRARSIKERYSKICIVVEEADETLFWIEFMQDLKMFSESTLNNWFKEAEEIVKATSSYKKHLKDKLIQNQ